MIGLLQRVSHASVSIEGKPVGAIEAGLMVLVGIQKTDGTAQAERLLERLLGYRVFPDAEGKMNLSLRDTGGGLLLVPQFTLAADTDSGTRASFTTAAEPALAKILFEGLVATAKERYPHVGSGVFGADMQVTLTNDGPVTFWLEVR